MAWWRRPGPPGWLGGGTSLQIRHAAAGAVRVAPVDGRESLPRRIDPGDHTVAIEQRDLHAHIGLESLPFVHRQARLARPAPVRCLRRMSRAPTASDGGTVMLAAGDRAARAAATRRVDRHQATDTGHAQHPQDGMGR